MSKIAKRDKRKVKTKRSERSDIRERLRSFLMFLPNMVLLLGRLLKDARVPAAEKALFAAAIVYVISPLDFIPDVFPFIGQVDDLYVVALVLLRLINRTNESVVRQHWSGGGDIVALADSIASIAPKFLPKRVSRVITARVELAPAGNIIRGITHKDQPVVREVKRDDKLDIEPLSEMAN
jgi:uncharacterized membrane protein YkvA (DUF1232 family)